VLPTDLWFRPSVEDTEVVSALKEDAASRQWACKKVESLKQHVDLKQPVLLSRLVLAWEIYNATSNFLFLKNGYRIVSEKQMMHHRSTTKVR
jgi:hypothetical protein